MSGFSTWFDDIDDDERREREQELDRLRDTYSDLERQLARAFRNAARAVFPTNDDGDPVPERFDEQRVQNLIDGLNEFARSPQAPQRTVRNTEGDPPAQRTARRRVNTNDPMRPTQVRVQPPEDELDDERADLPSRGDRPRRRSNDDSGKPGDSRPRRDDKTKPRALWDRLTS